MIVWCESYALTLSLSTWCVFCSADRIRGFQLWLNVAFKIAISNAILFFHSNVFLFYYFGSLCNETNIYQLFVVTYWYWNSRDVRACQASDGDDVLIGVCSVGLLVFKDKLRIHRYTWPKILKIRYKRNNFFIDIRPEPVSPFITWSTCGSSWACFFDKE